jgi:hypothetical protein
MEVQLRKIWLYFCPNRRGPTLPTLYVYKSQSELVQSPEFQYGADDVAMRIALEDIFFCNTSLRILARSNDKEWNEKIEAAFRKLVSPRKQTL